ncbi:aromatic acid exporter family protein [Lentibacillus saliphilus]|uniref:aromatic acid exporter family protein n=1 Tax=Lentibacillus saliphilus TaxID=2737028 RepID=UPI001C30EA5B|nr:aromatic acid exporter family protein [Lentibacillus saliphilus]
MRIGYRTIKTALGTAIAISIAQGLDVSNFVTAGILTILCIQPSRKRSVTSAWDRFLACILIALFSMVFFEILGYTPLVVGLLLTVFIPITVWLKITPGIVTSSVIMLNLYASGEISIAFLLDQFILILIGIGTALLLNLYMPSLDRKLDRQQEKLEAHFQIILKEISLYIRNNNEDWDGKELQASDEILTEAMRLVEIDKENHLLRSHHPYYDYFTMRKRQLQTLRNMLPLVTKLSVEEPISLEIAQFFERLSESVHPGNTAIVFLDELSAIKQSFNDEALPATREEFETRANLYRMLYEIEQYLTYKHRYKKTDIESVEA